VAPGWRTAERHETKGDGKRQNVKNAWDCARGRNRGGTARGGRLAGMIAVRLATHSGSRAVGRRGWEREGSGALVAT
jgi:hypothetical protein